MAIFEVTDSDVLWRCGKCGGEGRLALDSLEVGLARKEYVDARVIALPVCRACGSSELLFRAPDDEVGHPAPGSLGHLHRLLVNHLHAELVARQRVHSALSGDEGQVPASIARPVTADDVRRWFPTGMGIGTPPSEGLGPEGSRL